MKRIESRYIPAALIALVATLFFAVDANAQTNTFTYQGRLTDAGSPANGNYDFQFTLYDSLTGGNQIGTPMGILRQGVDAGVYRVLLDFGVNAFGGGLRYLEIQVRPAVDNASFVTLTPRQLITSTPYAIRSFTAAGAETATLATNANQLGGVNASNYVQTNDARLTDARTPTAGSSNYIQNTLTKQSNSNFSISGSGRIGGNLITDGGILASGPPFSTAVNATITSGVALSGQANGAGSLGVWASGTSWFQGDTTPLLSGYGKGVAVGYGSSDVGYVFAFDYGANTAKTLALNSPGGNVGIGTASPNALLTVNGTASKPGGGAWSTFSDERLKNIKGRFTSGLKAVMQLQPLRYEYKRDNALGLKANGEFVGFGAKAVQKVIPEAVSKDERGYLLVNNDPIMLTMLNAIKEQQQEIECLSRTNAVLSARLHSVEHRLRAKSSRRR